MFRARPIGLLHCSDFNALNGDSITIEMILPYCQTARFDLQIGDEFRAGTHESELSAPVVAAGLKRTMILATIAPQNLKEAGAK